MSLPIASHRPRACAAAGAASLIATALLAACGGDPAPPTALHLYGTDSASAEPVEGAAGDDVVDSATWLADQPIGRGSWFVDPVDRRRRLSYVRVPGPEGRLVALLGERIRREDWRPATDDCPRPGECVLDGPCLVRLASDEVPATMVVDHPMVDGGLERVLTLSGDADELVEMTLGQETRRARVRPVGDAMTFELDLPEGAHLDLGAALRELGSSRNGDTARLAPLADDVRVTFRVRVESAGDRELVWERTVGREDRARFLDAQVDLTRWEGRRVRVLLETEEAQGQASDLTGYAAWAEPLVWTRAEAVRPNVLVLQLDTMRADRLGAQGWDSAHTPNLDALAARGVRFDQAMSAASWTLPSHASMFTSTYPSQHGVWKKQRLPAQTVTVAEVLRAGGYRTAAFAEGGFVRASHGFARGFDRFLSDPRPFEQTFELAEEWIRRPGPPFFAFVQTYKVHAPYRPAPAFVEGRVRSTGDAQPFAALIAAARTSDAEDVPSPEVIQHVSDLYDAEITELDAYLGEYLERLEVDGLLENTLLIVTSDHGEEFFEHGSVSHGASLYQEQLHVPLILFQPGRFEGGLVVEHSVHGVDLAPTIAAAADLPAPPSWVGLPWGPDPVDEDLRPLFFPMRTHWTIDPARQGELADALRIGSLKYVDYPDGLRPKDPQTGPRLYDLGADPGELQNLLDAEQRAAWVERVAEARRRFGPIGDTSDTEMDERLRQELEGLGYVGR